MPECTVIELPIYAPGTIHRLKIYRYGRRGNGPKVYIQAGIHADELPANLTAHHLRLLLDQVEQEGLITGEIVLLPVANPIGFTHINRGDHQGRYHSQSGQNYNRHAPNVAAQVASAIADKLGDDSVQNNAIIRRKIGEELELIKPENEAEALRLILMKMAYDADIMLDLHTDTISELHLYLDPECWPQAAGLAGLLEAKVVMFARNSGNDPFEETVTAPYLAARKASAKPVALPLACVIELRGEADSGLDLAQKDAAALMRFLITRGVIKGDAGEIPEFTGIAAPFSATQVLKANAAGIISFVIPCGSMVQTGDVIAVITDPLADDPTPAQVKAETNGRFFAHRYKCLVWPGLVLGKIHGHDILHGREDGHLLYD